MNNQIGEYSLNLATWQSNILNPFIRIVKDPLKH